VEELGSHSLMGQQGSPTRGLGGQHWASMLCGEGNLLVPAEEQSVEPGVHLCVWQWAPGTEYQVEGNKASSLNLLVPTMQ
jgi:hypothetical protein